MEAERRGQNEILPDIEREENAETGNRNERKSSQQRNPAGVLKTKSDRKPRRKRHPRLIEDGNTNANANNMEWRVRIRGSIRMKMRLGQRMDAKGNSRIGSNWIRDGNARTNRN
jgi:hypothetical protein